MKLILGDCLEKLKDMEDNSVDSIVTDPPYGISFMSKKWDYDVPKVEVWKEVLRVLKSGGHMLCACGTRTQHRMAVNIEDAGFEIRDIVMYLYGSGFPKSHNIGKAVDKIQGNEREETDYIAPDGKKRWGGNSFSVGEEPDGRGINKATKGTSKFEGWGTALKPSCELWTLARKPLSEKTVASNCLKWGTGGINIDECRVEADENYLNGSFNPEKKQNGDVYNWSNGVKDIRRPPNTQGRFPANLITDGSEEVVSGFPDSKSTGGSGKASQKTAPNSIYGEYKDNYISQHLGGLGDSGSASRFFYCAKSSKSERNKGLEGFEEKEGENGNKWTDQDYRRGDTKPTTKRQNFHPTVKPVKLMQYLCRLITPKEGIILDPFMGSGTTGIGAKLEGFDFIGIEMNEEYMEIAKARIDGWEVEQQLEL